MVMQFLVQAFARRKGKVYISVFFPQKCEEGTVGKYSPINLGFFQIIYGFKSREKNISRDKVTEYH